MEINRWLRNHALLTVKISVKVDLLSWYVGVIELMQLLEEVLIGLTYYGTKDITVL